MRRSHIQLCLVQAVLLGVISREIVCVFIVRSCLLATPPEPATDPCDYEDKQDNERDDERLLALFFDTRGLLWRLLLRCLHWGSLAQLRCLLRCLRCWFHVRSVQKLSEKAQADRLLILPKSVDWVFSCCLESRVETKDDTDGERESKASSDNHRVDAWLEIELRTDEKR